MPPPDGDEPERWTIWAAARGWAHELVAEGGVIIAAVPRFRYLTGHPTRTAHECLLIEGYEVWKAPWRPPCGLYASTAETFGKPAANPLKSYTGPLSQQSQ